MAGKFELYKDKAGEFRFRLKASNGQTLLASESYKTKASALAGIESVKKNAATPARYTNKAQTSGKPFFVLTATNGQTIGQSEAYDTEAARDKGVASVQAAADGAPTDDQAG